LLTGKLLTLHLELIKARKTNEVAAAAAEKTKRAEEKAIRIKSAKDARALAKQRAGGSDAEGSTTATVKGKGKQKVANSPPAPELQFNIRKFNRADTSMWFDRSCQLVTC
jgi:hypothetical protein